MNSVKLENYLTIPIVDNTIVPIQSYLTPEDIDQLLKIISDLKNEMKQIKKLKV